MTGLGRSLADIRRDLDSPPAASLAAAAVVGDGPLGRLIRDMAQIAAGAEAQPPVEFAQLTAGQMWAWLLEAPAEDRLRRLQGLLDAARQGARCWDLGHQPRLEALEERDRRRAARLLLGLEETTLPPLQDDDGGRRGD